MGRWIVFHRQWLFNLLVMVVEMKVKKSQLVRLVCRFRFSIRILCSLAQSQPPNFSSYWSSAATSNGLKQIKRRKWLKNVLAFIDFSLNCISWCQVRHKLMKNYVMKSCSGIGIWRNIREIILIGVVVMLIASSTWWTKTA